MKIKQKLQFLLCILCFIFTVSDTLRRIIPPKENLSNSDDIFRILYLMDKIKRKELNLLLIVKGSTDQALEFLDIYDDFDRPILERLYHKGKFVSGSSYLYNTVGEAIQRQDFDKDGKIIVNQKYLYNKNSKIIQSFSDSQVVSYKNTLVFRENYPKGYLSIDTYNEGVLESTELYQFKQLLERKRYFYQDGLLKRKVILDMSKNLMWITIYNGDGLKQMHTIFKEGRFLEQEKYKYTEDGKIGQYFLECLEKDEEYRYFYSDVDVLTSTEFYEYNNLVSVTHYFSDSEHIVDYYAFGSMSLSEYYLDGVLIEQSYETSMRDFFMNNENIIVEQ